ncbi:MAG: 3-deoxy-D-manno-octulosonic acid transferase [Chlamydiota bacterium]
MTLFLYNFLLDLFFILAAPWFAVQVARKKKYRAGIAQRLGRYPKELEDSLRGKRCVWVHAVSVGEVLAALPLVKALAKSLPGRRVVLSTVTLTGQRVAREKAGGDAAVIYFPLDLRFAVRRALDLVSPALVAIVETELWPNFIAETAGRGVPLLIVNGRISDRSFRGYRRLRVLLRRILPLITRFSMQTELDAERIRALGAPPEKVEVGGNMKFDCGISPAGEEETRAARAALGLREDAPVIVAGSTHRGEEEVLMEAFDAARRVLPGTAIVIVPRHPERRDEVKALCEARGARGVLRSRAPSGEKIPGGAILIADTIGELARIYRAATVVFVGKSLVDGGGQNIIEPASMGKPVVFGPSMHNFREASELLLKNRGAIQVADARGLVETITSLLKDARAREELGRRAAEAMAGSRGATQRNLELILSMLPGK